MLLSEYIGYLAMGRENSLTAALKTQETFGSLHPLALNSRPGIENLLAEFLKTSTYSRIIAAIGESPFQKYLRRHPDNAKQMATSCLFQHLGVATLAGSLPDGYQVLGSEATFDLFHESYFPNLPIIRFPLPGMDTIDGVSVPDGIVTKDHQIQGHIEATLSTKQDYLAHKNVATKHHRKLGDFSPQSRCVVVATRGMSMPKDAKMQQVTTGPIDMPFSEDDFRDRVVCPSRARMYREGKKSHAATQQMMSLVRLPFHQSEFRERLEEVQELQELLTPRRNLVTVLERKVATS